MNDLTVPRDLFLGLNNHKASFQLLKSMIRTARINEEIFYKIPVRVIYRTLWGVYTFVITYSIHKDGTIRMDIDKKVFAKNYSDYMALKEYCGTEVYEPCDSLRNYFSILGLINTTTTVVAKHGIWIWQK